VADYTRLPAAALGVLRLEGAFRRWFAVVVVGVAVSCAAGSNTADDQFMSRLATSGINGDRATLIADGHAECEWARRRLAHDKAWIAEGIRLLHKVSSDGVKTTDQWGEFTKTSGDIYCPELKQYGDQSPLGGGHG
jgi:hypothetical protein